MLVWLCALGYCFPSLAANPLDLQIRLTWGNGERRQWRGSIAISDGVLESPRCLGVEADAPDRYHMEDKAIQFQQRAPMSHDGIDVRFNGPEDAVLTVQLIPMDQPDAGKRVEINVADFIPATAIVHESLLDERRNRLVAQRVPGDRVRVEFERSSLVFSPEEKFVFEVHPHRLGQPEGTALRCTLQLLPSGGDEVLWKDQYDSRVDALGSTNPLGPVTVPLPAEEGVYDVLISLMPRRFSDAIVPGKPLFQRKLQLIIIDSKPRPAETTSWTMTEEFDSADPKWWARWLLLPTKLPGIAPKGPLGDKPLRAVERAGEKLQELGPLGWHAAPIPISQIGVPYILELEFPRGVRQTLGISILEADAAGDVGSKGLDSGIDVPDETPDAVGMEKHRLVFWPRTKSPWLLLTNRRDNGPALFGKMRVYAGPQQLPVGPLPPAMEHGRVAAVHFDKPLFAENFGAPETFDVNSNRSLRDWNTFYLSAIRLAEYLKFAGYNAAFIPVASDGTALYPTQLLDTMPKWDNGTFFITAQDPRPKDVLEVLLRIFDREGLTLIPTIQFGNTLPELEARLALDNDPMGGMALVGSYRNELKPSLGVMDARRGLAPAYNPLDLRVQAAMRRVTSELLERCRAHRSFGGLSLQLNPHAFSQFPDESWGLDDATFARFAQEHQIELPLPGSDPYAARLALTRGPLRDRWLKWRAFRLAEFYRLLQNDIARLSPHAPLYLDLHELMAGRVMQSGIRPQLPARDQLAESLLKHGVDPALWSDDPRLIVLRPQRVGQSASVASQATNIELANSAFADDFFQTAGFRGALSFHERQTLRVPGFDQVSPFGASKTYTLLSAHMSQTGVHARQNLVRSLVTLDATALANGGWMVPLGQEDALRPVLQVLTQLPAHRFETVPARESDGSIVLRTLTYQNKTYLYVANFSGLRAKLDIQFDRLPTDAQFDVLADRTPSPVLQAVGNSLALQLDKYDLVGFAIHAPGVRVADWSVDYDPNDVAQVKWWVQEFQARVDGLRNRRSIQVLQNPGFEQPMQGNEIAGWSCLPANAAAIRLEETMPRTGQRALQFRVTGANTMGKVRSNSFPLPRTGRLSVLAHLRISDPSRQPSLRMTIEGKLVNGAPIFMESQTLGMSLDAKLRPTNTLVRPLPTSWQDKSADLLFHVVDLPAGTAGEVSVGFDMYGPGEVWIDDVLVYDLYFHDAELNELVKQVGSVQLQMNSRRYGACQRFLEGYWPRFITEFAPAATSRISQLPGSASQKIEPTPPKPEEKPSRWKLKNPIPLKLRKDLF